MPNSLHSSAIASPASSHLRTSFDCLNITWMYALRRLTVNNRAQFDEFKSSKYDRRPLVRRYEKYAL